MVILTASLFGRLTGLWVGSHTAATVAALLVCDPLVVNRTSLMAEGAVLPKARISMLTPLRWAGLYLLYLRGWLSNNLLPATAGCYAHGVVFTKAIAPRHPLRDGESDYIGCHLANYNSTS